MIRLTGGVCGIAALAAAFAAACAAAEARGGALEDGFRAPPHEAKPHTWWHWMNGNVTKEGITADLEAIAEAGLGGVQLFDAGCEIPPGPVAFNTPAWTEHVQFAAREARRLGLEIVVPNCSGWSSSGGPWNPASNSMKRVVFTRTVVRPGETFRGVPPRPKDPHGFYEDIAVLAVPQVGADAALLRTGETRELDAQAATNVFTFALERPFEATALAVGVRLPGWAGQNKADVTVEVSDDGVVWRRADALVLPLAIDSIVIDTVQHLPLAQPVKAARWRVTVAPHLPGYMKTARLYALALENRAVVPGLDGKMFALRDQNPYPTHASLGPALAPGAAMDLTDRMAADGALAWTAPAGGGDWTILRLGYAANGRKNHPASRFGCGFECDKLSRRALDFHFEAYVGKLCRALGDLAGDHPSGLVGTLVDSYEIGCQNWTQGFEEEFRRRAGYSIRPFLPVLAGFVVKDAATSEKFLADYRQTISELFSENYAGALQAKCRQHGLKFSLEPYGNCPADDFEYGYFCDVPMSEFWVGEKDGLGTGNCRIAASIGHVWGKEAVGAEAFTAGPGPISGKWQNDPYRIKVQGDRAFCEGINRLIFHRFTHQPWGRDTKYLPGMTMGQWGTHFDRTNTWWPFAKGLFLYQARCQWLLRSGTFVADAAIYLGDKIPSTITPYDTRYVPDGWDCDAVNTRAVKALKVKDGRIVAPGGVRYRLLVTPDEPLTRPDAIAAVDAVRRAGGRVCRFSELKANLPEIDFAYSGTTADVKYVHREYVDGTEGYFVSYPDREKGATVELSLRAGGKTPEFWDAATGEIVRARDWREENGRTKVTWRAAPGGSVFVMLRPGSTAPVERVGREVRARELTGPWTLRLPSGKSRALERLLSWPEIDDPDFRYFSGAATYVWEEKTPRDAAAGRRTVLDLGAVKNLAVVTVNGRTFPALWKPPFRVDVTDALAADGPQRFEVKVVNLWPNRLIGDDFLPEDCEWKPGGGIKELPAWVKEGRPSPAGRSTFTTWKHWRKTDPLLPSGLLGPVRLVAEE